MFVGLGQGGSARWKSEGEGFERSLFSECCSSNLFEVWGVHFVLDYVEKLHVDDFGDSFFWSLTLGRLLQERLDSHKFLIEGKHNSKSSSKFSLSSDRSSRVGQSVGGVEEQVAWAKGRG